MKNILSAKIKKRKILYAFITALLIVFSADRLFPPPNPKPFSKAIYSENGELLKAYLTKDDKWRLRTETEKLPEYLTKAVIEKEDKFFYYHPGVNILAVLRAFYSNITSGERVSGASTITMQLVRILEPRERTYFNKFLEAIRALQFELHYSKKEILDLYLSYAPFGGNIEGITSAAYIYFNRSPKELSLAQSIALIIIPNDPNHLRIDLNAEETIKRRNKLLKAFDDEGIFPRDQIKNALAENLKRQRFSAPTKAPHFCNYISQRVEFDTVKTTLRLKNQITCEKLLQKYIAKIKAKGITNGAAIVIDNSNNEIVAYVGSANYFDAAISGQVNGVEAVRSPGSTLKPFLYAFGFDHGIITPRSTLLDIPFDFGGYEPENYDRKFNGLITVDYALVNSLNLPAVAMLRKIGLPEFIATLSQLGFYDIERAKEKLGLSLILGGCGVKLSQLTRAYSTFANKGNLFPLRYLKNQKTAEGVKVFSSSASYLIADILSSAERPDIQIEYFANSKLPKFAWKTGTSYGKRDAWAVGFNPRYTIGVWTGNFDGKGSPHLSGTEIAVPLLVELFNAIDFGGSGWFQFPDELSERKVCKLSGLLPSDKCDEFTDDYFIENVSSNKTCDWHYPLFVSDDFQQSFCTECLPDSGYRKIIYPKYPPELIHWLNASGIDYKKPPPHNPKCSVGPGSSELKIISPQAGFEYMIEKGSERKILLQVACGDRTKKIYWYVNDILIASGRPEEKIYFAPSVEKNKIFCVDDLGQQASLTITVKFY